MKKSLHIILALCIGLLIGTAGMALANDTVQASFSKFILKINGSAPVEIEPLTYKGTTYLPVREAANRLGYDVTYKSDSRTIELTAAAEEMEESSVVPTANESSISVREQIDQLTNRITSLQTSVEKWNHVLSITNDEKDRSEIQSVIEQTQREKTELERQKSELEAKQ